MKRNLQIPKWLLKVGMPASVAAFALMPLYGYLSPWPAAANVLQAYPEQSAILVGASYKTSYTSSGSIVRSSRSYALLPSVFQEPKTITITQVNSEPPSVREQSYGFLLHLAWFTVGLFGTWWFWFREGGGGAVQPGIQRDGPASGGSAR